MRLLEPVVADTVAVSFLGKESCSWTQVVPSLGQTISRSRSTSQESSDTGFFEGNDSNANDLSFKEATFSGEHTYLKCYFRLKRFIDDVIPLGCYAFPFQLTLNQGLPNSFSTEKAVDEVKRTTYKAETSYQLTAMLKNSYSKNESDFKCSNNIVVRNEALMKRTDTERTESTCQAIKACCCFNKGEISLHVTLDKVLFTLGEPINVNFTIENNTSDVQISKARIMLLKTINLTGERLDDEKKLYQSTEAFQDKTQVVVPVEMATRKRKSFTVPIMPEFNKGEAVVTSLGKVVKCRFYLEVEVEVPLDSDISVLIPVEVYPNAIEDWHKWQPPDWIQHAKVVQTDVVWGVPRDVLQSTEFANIPLPLRGPKDA